MTTIYSLAQLPEFEVEEKENKGGRFLRSSDFYGGTISMLDNSITNYEQIYRDTNYLFEGYVYDPDNVERNYYNGWIQYEMDSTYPISDNYSLTNDVDNDFSYFPDYNDYTMNNGSFDSGTFYSSDIDFAYQYGVHPSYIEYLVNMDEFEYYTFDFQDEPYETTGVNISWVSVDYTQGTPPAPYPDPRIYVYDWYRKCMFFYEPSTVQYSGSIFSRAQNNFSKQVSQGWIETLFATSNQAYARWHHWQLRMGEDIAIYIQFGTSHEIKYHDGNSWNTIYDSFPYYDFEKVRIEFDVNDDWHMWINDVSLDNGTGFDFYSSVPSIDNWWVSTGYSGASYSDGSCAFDNIRYSWDSAIRFLPSDTNSTIGDPVSETPNPLYMRQMFPNRYIEELWNDWILTYNSSYTESAFSSGTFESFLRDYDNETIAKFTNFVLHSGTVVENQGADLGLIDDDYITFGWTNESYHYPATYSFYNDDIGDTGTDISFIDWVSLDADDNVSIVYEIDNHRKVMKTEDGGDGTRAYYRHYMESTQTDFAFEFWIYKTEATSGTPTWLYLRNDEGTYAVWCNINDRINVYDGVDYYDTGASSITSNNWHHIKFIFSYTNDFYDVFLDNQLVLSDIGWWQGKGTGFDRIHLETVNTIDYFDAFGFSYDNLYYMGDNYHWNHYIGSEAFEDLNMDGKAGFYYGTESFEGYLMRTLGNYNGTYSFDDITMEEGVYYGTYDFRDEIGETGTDIDFVDYTYGDLQIEVISEYLGHKNVLMFNDTSSLSGNSGRCDAIDLVNDINNGSVDLWMSTTDSSKYTTIIFYADDGFNTAFQIKTINNQIAFYNGSYTYLTNFDNDVWYHIGISFNFTSDLVDVYINGTLKGNDLIMINDFSSLQYIRLISTDTHTDYVSYFDAIGYSWDDTSHSGLGYEIGWNFNGFDLEPLLNQYFNFLFHYGMNVSIVGYHEFHNYVLKIRDFYYSNTNYYEGVEDFDLYDYYSLLSEYYALENFDYTTDSGYYYGTYDWRDLSTRQDIIDAGYSVGYTDYEEDVDIVGSWNGHYYVAKIQGNNTAESGSSGNLEPPAQFGDFSGTYTGDSAGDLDENDGDYATIGSSSSQGSESSVYSDPNGDDTVSGWSPTPIWSNIDDGVRQPSTSGFSGTDISGEYPEYFIVDMGDVTIPSGNYITGVQVWAYTKNNNDPEYYEWINCAYRFEGTTGWSSEQSIGGQNWGWRDGDWNININNLYDDSEADALQVKVKTARYMSDTTIWYIEALYAQIYYASLTYDMDYTITWNIPEEASSIDTLYYEYRTTQSISFQMQIYDWTTGYDTVRTQTGTSWYSGSVDLSTGDYIDGSNQIRVHFHRTGGASSTDMDHYIDYLYVDYSTLQTNYDGRSTSIYDTFSQSDNTLEFWSYFTGTGLTNRIIFNNDTQIFHNNTDYYWYYENGTMVSIITLGINQWVHWKIVFDGNDVEVYVNGEKELDCSWSNSATSLTRIDFSSFESDPLYIDAIGYNWDSTSHSGLGYWTGLNTNNYDLLPLLQSSITDFDQYLTLNYDHYLQVLDNYDGHNNVLKFTDQSDYYAVSHFYQRYGGDDLEDGGFEFWWQINTTSGYYCRLLSYASGWEQTFDVYLGYNGGIYYHNGTDYVELMNSISADTWYHIRVDWDGSAQIYDVYVNGVLKGDNLSFKSGGYDVDYIRYMFGYYGGAGKVEHYIDDVGWNWDSSYSDWDNCNPFGVLEDVEENWNVQYSPFTSINIADDETFHYRVVNITDWSDSANHMYYEFPDGNQNYGTIDFWIKTDNINYRSLLYIGQDVSGMSWFYINDGKFQYYDGALKDVPNVGIPQVDTWHHITWHFCCDDSGYAGLGNDQVRFIIDGVDSGILDALTPKTYINRLYIYSTNDNTKGNYHTTYYDAFDFSWDSSYIFPSHNEIPFGSSYGNNFTVSSDETIEMWINGDFDKYFRLYFYRNESVVFSIKFDESYLYYTNGSVWNKDIYTANEWKHLKVYFEASTDTYDITLNGTLVAQDIDSYLSFDTIDSWRYETEYYVNSTFYIDAIGYSWDSGYDVDDNINPYGVDVLNDMETENNWVFYLKPFHSVNVIDYLDGHYDVINMTSNGVNDFTATNEFGVQRTTGVVEFWYYVEETGQHHMFSLASGSKSTYGALCYFRSDGSIGYYHDGWTWSDSGETYTNNRWYHIKIDFDCEGDSGFGTFDWYLDGVLIVDDGRFYDDRNYIDRISYYGHGGSYGGQTNYVDALGYDWESEYDEGYNTNPYGKETIEELEDDGYIISTNPDVSISIIGEYNYHRKILNLTDQSTTNYIRFRDDFVGQTSGIIEFYAKTTATDKITHFVIDDVIRFYFYSNGYIRVLDGDPVTWNNLITYSIDTWYKFKVIFDCSSELFDLYVNDSLIADDYDFYGSLASIDKFYVETHTTTSGYSSYLDSITYGTISTYTDTFLNISLNMQMYGNYSIPEDIVDLGLYYSHKTDNSTTINLEVWNYDENRWDLINSSINIQGFYDNYFALNNSHFNSTFDLKFNYYGYNETDDFKLSIDKFKLVYTWVLSTAFGDVDAFIEKEREFDFLDFFDDEFIEYWGMNFEFMDYLQIYNFTVGFRYRFTENLTQFDSHANFNNTYDLNIDGSWHDFSYSFEYNSTILSNSTFSFIFNITNGVLEFDNMYYYIYFECLNSSGVIVLQSDYSIHSWVAMDNLVDEYLLSDFARQYGMFFINMTGLSWNVTDDTFHDYYNSYGRQNLFEVVYKIKANDTWITTYTGYNSSMSDQSILFNITQFMNDNSLDFFQEFEVEFIAIGNNTEVELERFMFTDNRTIVPARIQFDIVSQLPEEHPLDYLNILYGWETNISQTINMTIYNFTSTSFYLINSSISLTIYTNNWTRYDSYNYINSSRYIIFHFDGYYNYYSEYEMVLDLEVNYRGAIYFSNINSFPLNNVWRYRVILNDTLDDEYSTDWVYFYVVDPIPNFKAISESEYTTRWDLSAEVEEIDLLERYSDDLTGDRWNLEVSDGDDEIYIDQYAVHDSYVRSNHSDSNYGNDNTMYVSYYNSFGSDTRDDIEITFIRFNVQGDYLTDNLTAETRIRNWVYYGSSISSFNLMIDNCGYFDENTITWNNQPASISFLTNQSHPIGSSISGYYNIYVGYGVYDCYKFYFTSDPYVYFRFSSSEYENINFRPRLRAYISKYYHNTTLGYAYIQSDESETLKLSSKPFSNVSGQSGDFFTIDCETDLENVDIELYSGGELVKTLNMLSGNVFQSRQEIEVVLDEDIDFDQIKFNSFFSDTKSFKLYDIKLEGYNETIEQTTLYVDPDGWDAIFLQPNTYLLKIYDNGILKVEKNITLTYYDLHVEVYEKPLKQAVYFTYYDSNNEYLNFNRFTTYINFTYNGDDITDYRLSENHITVDEDSIIYLKIYDSFEILVKTLSTNEEDFIDVVLDVYSLKIKNEAIESVSYTLSKDGSGITKSGEIFSEEIKEFIVYSGNYTLDYTNHEDDYPRSMDFEFLDNYLITINTTYHTVYFSMFTYDGLGVNPALVRFYINDERKDFGFNVIRSETANLIVRDFFNNTLANETIDASAYSEYNIFVEIYSLIILNQFTYEDIVVNITQVGSGVWMTQVIPKQFGFTYRFLPNVEYNITIYFTNQTFYDSRIVNLTDNSHIESFGVATTTPEYPKDVYFSIYTGTGLAIQQQLVKFYIDGDRADFGFNTIENMIITLTVKDFFNTTLFNQMVNTSGIYEYDILIDIYSLKIKNEAEEIADYELKLGALTETGKLFPQEIVEYQLASTNYEIDWTNNEDGSSGTIAVNLIDDRLYTINTTYYQVYLALYNFYGVVMPEEVRFYINNTRSDFGFNTIKSDDVRLQVLDFFNNSLYDQVVTLSGLKEYSIFIRAYTMIVENEYNTQSIKIEITRGTITLERFIEAQGYTEFKLFPNISYSITAYDLNDTKIENKDVNLTTDFKIVEFGFYSEQIPEIPDPFDASNFMIIFWAFLIVFIISVSIMALYVRFRKDIRETDELTAKQKDMKTTNNSFDNRFK